MSLEYSVFLRLADRSEWSLTCFESPAKEIANRLAHAMNLILGQKADHDAVVSISHGQVASKEQGNASPRGQLLIELPAGNDNCLDIQAKNFLMSSLGNAWACLIQQENGVLLHGALAEWRGRGVLFAGPGGIGKSTTSRRLPPGWRSLCDDACLVIEHQGTFYAHPWPTWSDFFDEGTGGRWNVREYVPLKAIFLLNRSEEDHLEKINQAEAAVSLVKSNEQITGSQIKTFTREQRIQMRMKVFETISKLARTVPVLRLYLRLDNDFGGLLEDFLAGEG